MVSERTLSNQKLIHFAYLQLLDLMTTVAFLVNGVQEANPLVRFVIDRSPNPLLGLLVMKLVAVVVGCLCWRGGRTRILSRINRLFALVVAWNLAALIIGTARAT